MLAESNDRWADEIRRQGLQQGKAQLLLRQLRLKFGPLKPKVAAGVYSAEPDLLLKWGERVLTAERLPDVFQETTSIQMLSWPNWLDPEDIY